MPPPNAFRGTRELLPSTETERRWIDVRRHIPMPLSPDVDAILYGAMLECCSRYLTGQGHYEADRQSVASARKDGGKGVSPLAKFVAHLRAAADIWPALKAAHDDRLGLYDKLEVMAENAALRLREIQQVTAVDPWPQFVVDVADACRRAGLDPTATGRVYEEDGKPTWFQAFMAELDMQLLGSKNLVWDDQKRDHRAFYAGIAKALRGDGNRGNPPE